MTLNVEPLVNLPVLVELRVADAAECMLGFTSPREALEVSVVQSLHSYVATWNGQPFAYWGYVPTSTLGASCFAWMLTTPLADTIPIPFGRLSRRLFHTLRTRYPVVLVAVDPAHELAIRWLEWLGFGPFTTIGPLLLMRYKQG